MGVKAGIGVGVPIFVILPISAGVWFINAKSARKNNTEGRVISHEQTAWSKAELDANTVKGEQIMAAHPVSTFHEMDGTSLTAELDGSRTDTAGLTSGPPSKYWRNKKYVSYKLVS